MKKSQLLAELVSYDLNKGWKRRRDGEAPVVQELKAFLATRVDANDALIPYADFVSYLQAQGQVALVAEQALVGKSLSQVLIRRWKAIERAAGQKPAALPANALDHNGNPHILACPLAARNEEATRHNNAQWLLRLPTDLWRSASAIPRHLDLRSLSRLAQTCSLFRKVLQLRPQQGHAQIIRPLLPRLHDEHDLREELEALIKISDDLSDSQGHVSWSGKPAMEKAKALVVECKEEHPNLNLFYKQGPLQTLGLPPLYLAASRSNKVLWQWLHDQLLEQVPEAERSLVSAIAHLQWHATNQEFEPAIALLTEHPGLVFAKSPLLTWNSTPLYIAASLQYRDIYDLLVSQAPPDYARVSELMWLVMTGSQDAKGNYEAANYIENNPELMLMSSIDGLSPWQIACARGDTRLMKALLAKLPADGYKAASLQQEEVDKNDWHSSPAPFFKAYQTFIDGVPDWIKKDNCDALDAAWLRVGDEFRRQPQHRQALYFQAYPLDPLPDFKKVGFQRACVFGNGDNLFPIRPAAGPGFEFSVLRSKRPRAYAARIDSRERALVLCHAWRYDLLAQKALYVRNQEEYLEIKQSLHDKVAPLEAAPGPGLG
jgi:hypothetical protein